MFGFLFKIFSVALLVVAIYAIYNYKSTGQYPTFIASYLTKLDGLPLPNLKNISGSKISPDELVNSVSDSLDKLVTHSREVSPVVLGVKVTNESLGALTDVLLKLPTDQLDEVKNTLCAPLPTQSQ